jgi:dipeptidyl aminopeptidase/acylaminoacyl peptidase
MLAAGCGFAAKPGVADVPPLAPTPPGVYSDINPRWSSDGERIAFLRSTPDRRLQLFVSDGDLDQATALLEPEIVSPDRPYDPGLCRYSSPDSIAWSPDGIHIAFERAEWFQFDDGQRLPGTGIWSFDVHTGRVSAIALHPKRYTNLYYYYHAPAWSPDGRYVAFIGEGINGQRLLGLRCVDVQKPKEVAPRFDNYASTDWPAWRGPHGPSDANAAPVLAYCREIFRSPTVRMTAAIRTAQPGSPSPAECREVWRMRPAPFAALAAVRERSAPGEVVEPRIGSPAWSPDGRRIAFTLTPDANDRSRYAIWVVDVRSGAARAVSPDDGRGYFAPVWIGGGRLGSLSPDGDRFHVVAIDVASRSARPVGVIDTADCDWSPDRRRIVYAAAPSGRPNSADNPTTLRMLETKL